MSSSIIISNFCPKINLSNHILHVPQTTGNLASVSKIALDNHVFFECDPLRALLNAI